MTYYNIHTHTHQLPAGSDERAIVNMIVGETGYENIRKDIAGKQMWCSVGIHPWYIYNVREQFNNLESIISAPSVVAIGEAGLDKLAKTSPDIQLDVFLQQASLAEKTNKPLIIHCVKAWAELIAARKKIKPHIPWIIHGFRGNGELARQLVAQGFYLSFGQYYHPAALKAAWPDRLFAETDDREIDIRIVYRQLALSLQISLEEFASEVERNVCKTFPIVPQHEQHPH